MTAKKPPAPTPEGEPQLLLRDAEGLVELANLQLRLALNLRSRLRRYLNRQNGSSTPQRRRRGPPK